MNPELRPAQWAGRLFVTRFLFPLSQRREGLGAGEAQDALALLEFWIQAGRPAAGREALALGVAHRLAGLGVEPAEFVRRFEAFLEELETLEPTPLAMEHRDEETALEPEQAETPGDEQGTETIVETEQSHSVPTPQAELTPRSNPRFGQWLLISLLLLLLVFAARELWAPDPGPVSVPGATPIPEVGAAPRTGSAANFALTVASTPVPEPTAMPAPLKTAAPIASPVPAPTPSPAPAATPGPTLPPQSTPKEVVAPTPTARPPEATLDQVAPERSVDRPPSVWPLWAALSAAVTMLAAWLLTAPHRRRAEDLHALSHYEPGTKGDVEFEIPPVISFRQQTLDGWAVAMGRLALQPGHTHLDVPRTIEMAVKGGSVQPVFQPSRGRLEWVFVIDLEGSPLLPGSRWLYEVECTLDRLEEHQAPLVRFYIQGTPELASVGDRQRGGPDDRRGQWCYSLSEPERLGRALARYAGHPLVFISGRLERFPLNLDNQEEDDGELRVDWRKSSERWQSWIQELRSNWPSRKAWLDLRPTPDPSVERNRLIQELERHGLRRFPWSDEGVEALVRYMDEADYSALQVSPHVAVWQAYEAGLRWWAYACWLVPDGRWALVQYLRQRLIDPSMLELPGAELLELLIQYVDHLRRDELGLPLSAASVAESGSGRLLIDDAVGRRLARELSVEPARREAFEQQVYELLKERLEGMVSLIGAQPDNLKRRYRSVLELSEIRRRWYGRKNTAEVLALCEEVSRGLGGGAGQEEVQRWLSAIQSLSPSQGGVSSSVWELLETVLGKTRHLLPQDVFAMSPGRLARALVTWAVLSVCLWTLAFVPIVNLFDQPVSIQRWTRTDYRVSESIVSPTLSASSVVPEPEVSPTPTPGIPSTQKSPVVSRDSKVTTDFRPALREIPLVNGGKFLMGAPDWDNYANSDEKPQHEVQLQTAFWMFETEVTQGQMTEVMKALDPAWKAPWLNDDCKAPSIGDRYPAVCVTWDEARLYADALTLKDIPDGRSKTCYYEFDDTGKRVLDNGWKPKEKSLRQNCQGYRLPTEAEWEYAARAGGTWNRWAGTNDEEKICEYANIGACMGKYAEVGLLKDNGWGLKDMSGSVWEWVGDYYGDYPAGSITDTGGSLKGSFRVFRGGSWGSLAQYARVSNRLGRSPDVRLDYQGFRLSRSLP